MLQQTKNKWLMILILLLVLANAATLVSYWINNSKNHTKGQPIPGMQPSRFLIEQLNFNDDQQKRYRVLIKEHQEKTRELRKQMRDAKENMFTLMSQGQVPDSTLRQAASAVGHTMESLDMVTFRHFQEVRKLCTPEQVAHFDKIIHEVLSMMAPHPGPGGPGRPGSGRPDFGPDPMHDAPPPPNAE